MANCFVTPTEMVKTYLPKIAEGDCHIDPEGSRLEQWFPGTKHPRHLEIHRWVHPEFEYETLSQELKEAYRFLPEICPFAGLEKSNNWCQIGFFEMDDAPLVLFADCDAPRIMYLADFEPKGVWTDISASFEEFRDALSIKRDLEVYS